ncbi:hypothetical protein GA0111570_11043 [Raineyella antarctica]|uniref:Uncharacterized protein n=1 Tax=Raineyella antarctica TaxID=1577474 RepID=A0A1G6HHB5_9ACTN|nr:hypothetical protein [Raineyella antarctica]SDB93630.1 hypothetical protein GA0111570_11043 [Raineyella antarctica]
MKPPPVGRRGLLTPQPLIVTGILLLLGLSGAHGWEAAACPSLPPGLSVLGIDVSIMVESPVCGLNLHDLGVAVIQAGPLAWSLCLGSLLLGSASLLGTTGLGLALHRLLRRVRDWFVGRLPLPRFGPGHVPLRRPERPANFRLPDLRSIIVQRDAQRRGPPLLLVHG